MEWRTILAVVLSILVLVVWQYFSARSPNLPEQPLQSEPANAPPRETVATPPGVMLPSQPPTSRAGSLGAAHEASPKMWNERLQTAIFTPSVRQLTVSERQPSGTVRFEYVDPSGWRIVKSVELHYGTYAMEMKVTVVKPRGGETPSARQPPAGSEAAGGLAEQLITLENDLVHMVMTTRGARIKELLLKKYAAARHTPPNLVWRWDYLWGNGASGSAQILHDPDATSVNLIAAEQEALTPTLEVSADGRQALLRWGPGFYTDPEANGSYSSPLSFVNGERWLDTPKAGQAPLERTGNIQWTSVQNKYYAVAFIPHTDTAWTVLHQGTTPADYAVGLRWPLSESVTETHFTVYAGPKELDRLATFEANGKSLAELVYYNFGWVRVVRPDVWLLAPLQWLYRATHNYGIAIIIITVVIKILFYPLTLRSFKSMQAMQHLQPQVKRLQDMYKEDRQKLNEEMMKLYREQKVNPLGGCLPMVVQIPVFISLYQVLYTSIELRHAAFIWWIHDLSAPDHPLAIVMGGSMVIQQWMTPTTGDPRQAKMMMFMPIIFTFMFLNFPVGLVIYWLINNLLTIAQQYVILRKNRST